MKNIFSLVTLTAAALSFAVFFTSLPGERMLGLSPATAAAVHGSDHGCRLQGPLLANGLGGPDLLSRLSQV